MSFSSKVPNSAVQTVTGNQMGNTFTQQNTTTTSSVPFPKVNNPLLTRGLPSSNPYNLPNFGSTQLGKSSTSGSMGAVGSMGYVQPTDMAYEDGYQ